jgi:hypothetical protein
MNELLDLVLEAHGGLKRWNKVQSVKMEGSITRSNLVCEEQA